MKVFKKNEQNVQMQTGPFKTWNIFPKVLKKSSEPTSIDVNRRCLSDLQGILGRRIFDISEDPCVQL
jgi:hypothetical protein